MPKVILASTSPRRQELLGMLGVEFEAIPADIDETKLETETPQEYVHRLAIGKAAKVAEMYPEAIVIGGDVTVDIHGEALAKAESRAEAKGMLQKLSGQKQIVRDAFAVFYQNQLASSGVVNCEVEFKPLTEAQLEAYLDSNEWEGKAGAYGIQGKAGAFIANIRGSYYDILGLPVYHVYAALVSLGITPVAKLDEIYQQDLEMQKTTLTRKM
jgi:septum formation protein